MRYSRRYLRKESHNFLTLYGRTTSMPFLQNNNRCWSEFDFHMNSDVVYLTGDTFMPDTCSCTSEFVAKMQSVPDVKEDSIVISGNKDSMNGYMDEAIEETTVVVGHCLTSVWRIFLVTLLSC